MTKHKTITIDFFISFPPYSFCLNSRSGPLDRFPRGRYGQTSYLCNLADPEAVQVLLRHPEGVYLNVTWPIAHAQPPPSAVPGKTSPAAGSGGSSSSARACSSYGISG